MDPLSILGVAAAAVQFVDFGQRLLSETWHIYHSASGQTLRLQNLSAISADISKLSMTIRETFKVQQQDASALDSPDKELLHLCQECEDIATKILAVMPNISKKFETHLAADKEVVELAQQNGLRSYELKSVGECFRVALRSWWSRDEIAKLGERLEKVRQGMVTAATMSIWRNSQSTKNWEHQLSSKLDTMIERLSQPLEVGPLQNEGYTYKIVDKAATESLRRNNVIIQIQDRLWRADWKPDTQLLSSFPKQTGLSVEELNSFICDSLRFDSMDYREEAITKSFGSTFQWVFDRDPRISLEGAPMWSSFPAWLESNTGLPYWITGKPGSGKSTMMKFILQHSLLREHLHKWSQGTPQYTIKYYAWRPGAETARSEDGLLRTLLHQILDLNPKMIPFLCPRRWSLFHAVREVDSFPPWTTWELDESFRRLLQMEQDGPLLAIFIDGLDEFDVAPVDLCKRILTISSHKSVKVCVASRPWPQFSDAFTASPGLQMHLLTNADIQSFIRGHFQGVVAFQELNDVYQGSGEVILADIASRSKGVFLWTSLVTQTLLESLIEGSSLAHLQDILDTMTSEIEDLYDAIYAAIPKRLLPEVSVMLQLYVRAFQPVDWITLWLADEARSQRTDPPAVVRDSDMEKVQVVLKRRLGARTRGILELVPQTRTVEYLHRTAAEWVNLPRVWQQIKSVSPPGFDPHACLLQAEVIQRENPDQREPSFNPGDFYHMGNFKFWKNVVRTLHYASQVDETIFSDTALADVLDRFHDAATKKFTKSPGYVTLVSEKNMPWTSYHHMKPDKVKVNTFDGLATQFAILHYIRHKFHSSPNLFHAVPKRFSTALLEQAIFGPEAYFSEETIEILNQPNIQINTKSRRLQVVEFLLQQGVRQPGVLLKVNARRLHAGNQEDAQYLDAIIHLLNRYRAISGEKRSLIKGLLSLK